MRKITLMTTFVCVVIMAQAQPEENPSRPKGYLDIAIGASVPLGDYTSNDPRNSSASGANTGFGLNLGYGHLFGTKRIAGISAHAGFHFHPMANQTFTIPVGAGSGGGYSYYLEAENGSYLNFPFTAGLLISIPIKNHAISIFAEGGATIAISPKIEAVGSTIEIKISPNVTPGIAFTTGIAPRLYLSEKIAISPIIQYSYFKTTFNDLKTEIWAVNWGSRVKYYDIEVKGHILFTGVGVTINLASGGVIDSQKPLPPSNMDY